MDTDEVRKRETGTTTLGMKCNDGVILAAEKRATAGTLIACKEADKVLRVHDHIGMTIAGLVGDAQTLNRILKAQCALYEIKRGSSITVEGASTLLGNILQQTKYFPYWVQILVGGYDTGSRLYSVDAAGGVLTEDFISTGSGSPVAYGVLEDSYQKNKTIKELLPLAARAITAAMKRDSASGERVDIAIIDRKGFRKLSRNEIDNLVPKK
jgi:proteasome beta subunit